MESVLEKPVLVLNRLWQPLHTTSVRRALKLLFLGHAEVVQTEGECRYQTHDMESWASHSQGGRAEELVKGVRTVLRAPKIIVLALYDRLPRKEVKFTRQNVFLRDKHTCQYCVRVFPEKDLNLDHVVPRVRGGKTTWENIVTSCVKCNTRKGYKSPEAMGMKLQRKPTVPRWRPLFGMREVSRENCWEEFLSPNRQQVMMAG